MDVMDGDGSKGNLDDCPYRGINDGDEIPGTDMFKCYPCTYRGTDFEECLLHYSLTVIQTKKRLHHANEMSINLAEIERVR
jgi:hypothetical protein